MRRSRSSRRRPPTLDAAATDRQGQPGSRRPGGRAGDAAAGHQRGPEAGLTISDTTGSGETTLFQMMLRPRWIGALVLALALAAGFAWLGQWQLRAGRRLGQGHRCAQRDRAPARAGGEARRPDHRRGDRPAGDASPGSFVPADYQLLQGRLNSGDAGWWVVAPRHDRRRRRSGKPVALAVARGWAPTRRRRRPSRRAWPPNRRREPRSSAGSCPPRRPRCPTRKGDPTVMTTMSVAALYNLWTDVDGVDVYAAYVVEATPPDGLDQIDSPAADPAGRRSTGSTCSTPPSGSSSPASRSSSGTGW